jgi:hypothetical protein
VHARRTILAGLALAAFASAPVEAGGPKRYFLTVDSFPTTAAPTACGKGYHMASLFELVDLAALAYDLKRGQTTPDAGAGPPAGIGGWVRTGNLPSTSSSPGFGNCSAWTSTDPMEYGSLAELGLDWAAPAVAISPWVPDFTPCDNTLPVWCRQD